MIKTRKLTQPTKKLDCPVVFNVKKIFRFPKFKIDHDTKWNRSVASKQLRNILMSKESQPVEGHLEFITRFPQKG